MKIKVADIIKAEVLDDNLTARIVVQNESGQNSELLVSVQAYCEIASILQKLQLTKHQGADVEKAMWNDTPMCAPHNWQVALVPVFSPPAVALVFDLGAAWKMAYRLHPSYTADIGRALIEFSEKALKLAEPQG